MTNLVYSVEVGTNIDIEWDIIDGVVWRLNGKIHREGGPAVEESNGTRRWVINGEGHREDGPAIERDDGSKEWIIDNYYHREDGPAIERSDGTKEWYIEGDLNREDGPAIEHPDGTLGWYLEDIEYSEEDWRKELERRNKPLQLTIAEICDRLGVNSIEIIED